MRVLAYLLVVPVGAVSGYGFWYAQTHAYLNLDVVDEQHKDVLNAQLSFGNTKWARAFAWSRKRALSPTALDRRLLPRHGARQARGTGARTLWPADSWEQTTLRGSKSNARAHHLGAARQEIRPTHGTAYR